MILHIFKSHYSLQKLQELIANTDADDALMLLSDGIYLLNNDDCRELLKGFALNNKLFVIADDLSARGLSDFSHPAKTVTYPEFVELTLQYDKTLSW